MEFSKAEKVKRLLKAYEEAKAKKEGVEMMNDYLRLKDIAVEDKIGYILNQVRDDREHFYGFLEKMFAEWIAKIAEDAMTEMERVRAEIEAL